MPTVLQAALLTLWVVVLAASRQLTSSVHVRALAFTLLGASALALLSFSTDQAWHGLRDAATPHRATRRTSAVFWEATARNAWLTGVLGSVLVFVLAFSSGGTPPEHVTIHMALAFVPAVYGMGLAGAFLLPALKLRDPAPDAALSIDGGIATSRGRRGVGLLLFLVLIATSVWIPPGAARIPGQPPWRWLVHLPAVLFVLGAALGGRLFAGERLGRRIGTALLAGSGLLGALVGVVRVLVGMASHRFDLVTSGLSFILSAAFVALVAMATLSNPAEDRRVLTAEDRDYSAVSRTAWLLLPLLTLLFLLVSHVIVVTPIPMNKG